MDTYPQVTRLLNKDIFGITLKITSTIGDPWRFGADQDPHLWLMDPDLDPTPDPTPFFSDFKDANFFLHIFFNLPADTLSSVLKILFFAKICLL